MVSEGALDLLDKRLLVISGKGGVGKTVISSALAQLAARRGQRVLLVKIDDHGRTSQLFANARPLTDQIQPLAHGVSGVNLDPKTVVGDYFYKQLRVRGLVRHIVNSQLFDAWFRVSPAIKEMILLGKVWSLVEERSWWSKQVTWDLVIFDAPATGHGLGLLKLPEQASKLLIGPMRKSALAVGAMLADPRTTGVLVTTIPEEMPVNEALHFVEQAHGGLDVNLCGLVLNAAFPRHFLAGDLPALEALAATPQAQAAAGSLGGSPRDWLRAARYGVERGELTERYRQRLLEQVRVPLLEVPYVFAERFGPDELAQVSDHLQQALEQAGQAA